MSNCCTECFNDEYLKALIDENGAISDCYYCESENVKCIDPADLTDTFEPLVDQYQIVEIGVNRTPEQDPLSSGDRLADRIDYEWNVFSDLIIERKHDLLSEIVNSAYLDPKEQDYIDVNDLWTERSRAFTSHSMIDEWVSFAFHLRHIRRYIPNPVVDDIVDPRDFVNEALAKVDRTIPAGTEVFRARNGGLQEPRERLKPYPAAKMGAPSLDQARAGRMNPAGIPYLYVALSEYTAVAEIRPWKGSHVTVGKFVIPNDLRVADLTDALRLSTPFGIDNLSLELRERALLRYLGRQLGRPVSPDAADIEYVPTQYLTELIQEEEFEAIKYESALGREPNVVIFSHDNLFPEQTWLREVTHITYEFDTPGRRLDFDD